jgi:endonuclease/exonuclease/phosphatase family metal-dependent hydrolase
MGKSKNGKQQRPISRIMLYATQRTKALEELSKSLEKIENHNITNIVLIGDFNCPDIRWDTQTACGPDREIQQELADLMGANNLTQIHDSPTRENNLLDLAFVSNPTLVKSSVNVPGISDHEIIITDFETSTSPKHNTQEMLHLQYS